MASASTFLSRLVYPGDELVAPLTAVSTDLRLGDGLKASPTGDSISALKAGLLSLRGQNRFSIQTASKRYIPAVGDVVVGVVTDRNAEFYKIHIHGTAVGILPVLAFDGATKRNKPNLTVGAVVFARVSTCSKHMDPELTCQGAPPSKFILSVCCCVAPRVAALFPLLCSWGGGT